MGYRIKSRFIYKQGFTTLWNYTILKQGEYAILNQKGFTTLWNYTILKHIRFLIYDGCVLLPYEITLFSNN